MAESTRAALQAEQARAPSALPRGALPLARPTGLIGRGVLAPAASASCACRMCLSGAALTRPAAAQARAEELASELAAARGALAGAQAAAEAERTAAARAVARVGGHECNAGHALRLAATQVIIGMPNPIFCARTHLSLHLLDGLRTTCGV